MAGDTFNDKPPPPPYYSIAAEGVSYSADGAPRTSYDNCTTIPSTSPATAITPQNGGQWPSTAQPQQSVIYIQPNTSGLNSVIVVNQATLGLHPVTITCPYCETHVQTRVTKTVGTVAWIMCASCFIGGFFLLFPWLFCYLPFYIDSWKEIYHSCPACNRGLGKCAN